MNRLPGLSIEASLLVYALAGVVGLVVLVARFKLNAFVALILASVFVGLCSGMELARIGQGFADGMGGVLGSIAAIIGLGTMVGKMLAESGGARVIAERLIALLGPRRTHWSMMIVALIVGVPVFFAVGLVLLIPILFTVARETRTPLMWLGLPMLAGLSVSHGLLPPHPGPMTAIGLLNADTGRTLLYSLIIGVPVACLAGPVLAGWIIRREAPVAGSAPAGVGASHPSPPGFGLALFTVLLPVILMLLATIVDLRLPPGNAVRQWADFLGHPLIALLVSLLFSFYSFGFARGFRREQVLKFSEECLGPVAAVLLVVGAGGGFSRVLIYSGVGDAIAGLVKTAPVSPLILGWLVAALIRVATGSATVAISTAAGILAPVAAASSGLNLELLVLAMGAGSLILSHVNDGGFWLVKEYLRLSVTETLRTWTVMETVISIAALALVLLLDALL
ncbi:MAG TPA: permease DsdX [Verrucomicrobiales bacterium]|nr:permease DsdX [Verrucomicrobiales bacterium]